MTERVAIVGSRRRADRAAVEAAVAGLPEGAVVVSGGCHGPDKWAEEAALARGLAVQIFRPDTTGARNRGEASRRYHERNQRIVDAADRMIAFPAPDRTGGTEDAIRRARKRGIAIDLR